MNENTNFFRLFWGDIDVVKLEFDKLVPDFYTSVHLYLAEITIKRRDGPFAWLFCSLNYNPRPRKILGLSDRDNGKFTPSRKCPTRRFFAT